MGLFEKIFGSRKEQTLTPDSFFQTLNAYVPAFSSWQGGIYESELVRSAINAKAEHISKMSVKIDGSAQKTLQTKLRAAPNEFQTWSQFLYRLSTILDVNNTAFIVPVVNRYDETTGIFCVLPLYCELVEYNSVPYLRYQFGSGNTASIELSRCAIMTKYQYRNDFLGETNNALDKTMDLIEIQNQGIKEGVKSSATYRFMAKLSNFAKPDDLAKEQERFNEKSMKKGGGMLLFPNTYGDVKQIESKPFVVDADQMKVIQTNVYNYFGVNEKIMQNSANAEELDAFYNGSLEPFAIQLSEVLTKMLFTLREQASGAKVTVTSDRLQYMSVASKINLISTLGDRGMLTINEARKLLNYDEVDGGDAMMPIRGEYYNAKDDDTESEVNNEE